VLFNSTQFVIFLAVVLPLYYVLAHRWHNAMLLVASYVFYGSSSGYPLVLVVLARKARNVS
jgi:hypothetical protein